MSLLLHRIDIPSVAIGIRDNPIMTAPMREGNISMTSGIDRSGDIRIHLVINSFCYCNKANSNRSSSKRALTIIRDRSNVR